MSGDGDGWVHCAAGHRHWGLFGAAGVLISDGEQAILQHRAPWTHEGGTWGLPGGARDSHEDPTSTALREASEEAAINDTSVEPIAMWIDDHGGWSYTTVLAAAAGPITPHAANAESTDVRWWGKAEIDDLSLHHGLAAVWPQLRPSRMPLAIVIDLRADKPRLDELDRLVRHGLPVAALPEPLSSPGVSVLLPRITLVGPENNTGHASLPPAGSPWWRRAVTEVSSSEDPSAAVLAVVAARASSHQVVVVSADDEVRHRLSNLDTGVAIVDATWLIPLLDRHSSG